MKECDKGNNQKSSKFHMIFISPINVRHPVTKKLNSTQLHHTQHTILHSTSLHLSILHYTCRYFTSYHLTFTQLHFTTLSFVLNNSKFPTAPFHLTSLHFTSIHFTALLDDFRHNSFPFILPPTHVYFPNPASKSLRFLITGITKK